MPRKRARVEPVTAAFAAGAEIEVLCDEEGFWNAWYEATVALALPGRRRCEVVFSTLVTDDDPSCPLRESIRLSHIRPRAPRLADGARYVLYQIVDAFHNDGWWTGVVSAVHGGDLVESCTVSFPGTREVLDFSGFEIRPHMQWRDGEWLPPGDQAGRRAMFSVGDQIEVSGDKEKYGIVWFPGTIVKVIAKTILLVAYKKLKEDGSPDVHREIVYEQYIRPVRPRPLEGKPFVVLDEIEACHCGGWAAGVVLKIVRGSKYIVKLKYGKKEIELHHSEIRTRHNFTNGRWIPIPKRRRRPSLTSKPPDQPISVSPSSSSDMGHLKNMILKRKMGEEGPSFEGQVEALQPCKELKIEDSSNQLRVELVPKTPTLEANFPASMHDIESPPSDLVVRSPCVEARNLSFDLQALRRYSCTTELVAWSKESSNSKGAGLEQQSKTHNINHSWVNFLKRRKKSAIRRQKCQEDLDVIDVRPTKKRRGRPPNKRTEDSLKINVACTELQQPERTSDLVECEERSKEVDLSNRGGPDNVSYGIQPPSRRNEVMAVCENSRIPVDVKDSLENRSLPSPSKEAHALARSNSIDPRIQETSSFDNRFRDHTSNMSPSRRVSVEETTSIDPAPFASSSMKKTLPFLKSSSLSTLWESIDAMEVFQIMPQVPHFRQLEQYYMDFREGMAIALMVTFTNLVDNVKKLCIFDSQATFEEKLETLIPLEENGFDIQLIRSWIRELIEIRNNQRQLENKKDTLEEQIREREIEKDRLHALKIALDRSIMEAEQQLTLLYKESDSLVLQRMHKGSDIVKLQENVQQTKEAYLYADQLFDNILSSPW